MRKFLLFLSVVLGLSLSGVVLADFEVDPTPTGTADYPTATPPPWEPWPTKTPQPTTTPWVYPTLTPYPTPGWDGGYGWGVDAYSDFPWCSISWGECFHSDEVYTFCVPMLVTSSTLKTNAVPITLCDSSSVATHYGGGLQGTDNTYAEVTPLKSAHLHSDVAGHDATSSYRPYFQVKFNNVLGCSDLPLYSDVEVCLTRRDGLTTWSGFGLELSDFVTDCVWVRNRTRSYLSGVDAQFVFDSEPGEDVNGNADAYITVITSGVALSVTPGGVVSVPVAADAVLWGCNPADLVVDDTVFNEPYTFTVGATGRCISRTAFCDTSALTTTQVYTSSVQDVLDMFVSTEVVLHDCISTVVLVSVLGKIGIDVPSVEVCIDYTTLDFKFLPLLNTVFSIIIVTYLTKLILRLVRDK